MVLSWYVTMENGLNTTTKNMKKLVILFLLCIPLTLFAQNMTKDYVDGYAEGYAAGYKAAYEALMKNSRNSENEKLNSDRPEVDLTIDENDSYMVKLLHGKVRDKDGYIPEKQKIDKDYYIVFYGASWCPYCKKEAPLLKEFYEENKMMKDNFEVILAGTKRDKSNADLEKFMKTENFPFYYVDFNYQEDCKFFSFDSYTKCENFYVPAYILMDKDGNVLSTTNTESKEDYNLRKPINKFLELNK